MDIVSGKPVGKWLPKGWRTEYARSVAQRKIHHWPQRLLKTHSDLVESLRATLVRQFGFTARAFDDANRLSALESYAEEIDTIFCEGIGSSALYETLREQDEGPVLFTGGGIVPRKLLEISGLRMLHIHPGFLPQIRGSDCLLWSTLIAGRPSATYFYMAPGIDTGDIIFPVYLPRVTFDWRSERDIKTMYRIIYSFLDPWVRAFVLAKVLDANEDFANLSGTAQAESDGSTYYFMNERLRSAALKQVCGCM
jgi:hypothetical protein